MVRTEKVIVSMKPKDSGIPSLTKQRSVCDVVIPLIIVFISVVIFGAVCLIAGVE